MQTRTEPSRLPPVGASTFNRPADGDAGSGRRSPSEGGFTLIEVLICTLILTTGTLAIAALLAVTATMQMGAREATRSTRLAQDKVDQLMKANFITNTNVEVGGSLTENSANHWDTPTDEDGNPLDGITRRWTVDPGPASDTRILTVRVVNMRAQQYRETDLRTIIRQW